MPTVRIEHAVPDFDAWKKVFDSDPAGREQRGVRRYRVLRAVDSSVVMIDLDFDTVADAEAFLVVMRGIWDRVQGSLIDVPQARIAEVVEAKEFKPES